MAEALQVALSRSKPCGAELGDREMLLAEPRAGGRDRAALVEARLAERGGGDRGGGGRGWRR